MCSCKEGYNNWIICWWYLDYGRENEVDKFTQTFGEKYSSRVFDEVNDFIGCELVWNGDKSKVILHQSGMIDKMDGKVKYYLVNIT